MEVDPSNGSDERDDGRFLKRILMTVLVTLLAGGSAPWWWGEVLGGGEGPGGAVVDSSTVATRERTPGSADSPDATKEAEPDDRARGKEQSADDGAVETGSDTDDTRSDTPVPFLERSERVWSAQFGEWSTGSHEHGSMALGFGNSYVLEPDSNVIIEPGAREIPTLEGDFVVELQYRIEEYEEEVSVDLTLTGTGDDALQLSQHLLILEDGEALYSLRRNRVRRGPSLAVPHVVTEETFAERAPVPGGAVLDESGSSSIAVKRVGTRLSLFVGDTFVRSVRMPTFPVSEVGISAAFPSRIVLTSLAAREPRQGQ